MSERLIPDHHRRSARPSTPAERVIELTQSINSLEAELARARVDKADAEAMLARYQTIGGVSFGGIAAAQTWSDMFLWETLLNSYPVDVIVEIGTWKGGFSWFLWAQAEVRGYEFRTYDPIPPEIPVPGYRRLDVYADPDEVVADIDGRVVALFCDGGNKPRELRLFSKGLAAGSFVVVHDWGTETNPEDVPEWLEEIHGDICDATHSMSRVFKEVTYGG